MIAMVAGGCHGAPDPGASVQGAPSRTTVLGGALGKASGPAPKRPVVEDVRATLTAGYRAPHLFTISEQKREDLGLPQRDDVVTWVRHFDGVEMLSRPKSALVKGKWEMHRVRELAEPEPVRRGAVISNEAAIARAGLKYPETATARLVFKPEYIDLPKVANVRNAMDVETVIARHQLAIEVRDTRRGDVVWLDAYSGETIARSSLLKHVVTPIDGRLYKSMQLNLTPSDDGLELRDTEEATRRFTVIDSDGHAFNGQGVLRIGVVPDPSDSLEYETIDGLDPNYYDGALSLQELYDFYFLIWGRRGPRNLAPSSDAFFNEWVIYENPDATDELPAIHSDTAVIDVTPEAAGKKYMNFHIIGHEGTHMVFFVDALPREEVTNEEIGLNEATANLFSILIGLRGREHLLQAPSPVLGIVPIPDTETGWTFANEDSEISQNTDGELPVYLCNPHRNHPLTPNEWTNGFNLYPFLTNQDAAGPIERMLCLLSRGIVPYIDPNGNPDLKSSYLDPENGLKGLTGLGSETVARLWYYTLSAMHGYDPITFRNARDAMLGVVEPLYGPTSEVHKAVEDAFAAVNIGDPADRKGPDVTLPPAYAYLRGGTTLYLSTPAIRAELNR